MVCLIIYFKWATIENNWQNYPPAQQSALSMASCLMGDVAISGEYQIIGGNATL